MTQSLRLVVGDASAPDARIDSPSLTARPFRPGEMPRHIVVGLSDDLAATAFERARRAGVPVGLWLRIALEAVRHLEAAAGLIGADVDWLTERIDACASRRPPAVTRSIEGRELSSYAHQLETAREMVSAELAQARTVGIDVTDEMAVSWAAASTTAGLDAWVNDTAIRAPVGIIRWEAAAARAGATLGEWIYAAALRAASTSRSA